MPEPPPKPCAGSPWVGGLNMNPEPPDGVTVWVGGLNMNPEPPDGVTVWTTGIPNGDHGEWTTGAKPTGAGVELWPTSGCVPVKPQCGQGGGYGDG